MGALVTLIIKTSLQLLAGVGIGAVIDKVAADKLPAYPAGGVSIANDEQGKLNIPRLVWFVIAGVLATVILKYVARKFNIQILK